MIKRISHQIAKRMTVNQHINSDNDVELQLSPELKELRNTGYTTQLNHVIGHQNKTKYPKFVS